MEKVRGDLPTQVPRIKGRVLVLTGRVSDSSVETSSAKDSRFLVTELSLGKSTRIAEECIDNYLSEKITYDSDGLGAQLKAWPDDAQGQLRTTAISKPETDTWEPGKSRLILTSPTRAPPPPPEHITSSSLPTKPNGFQLNRPERAKSLFKPLEDYIRAAFANADGINASFLTSRPPVPLRSASEGATHQLHNVTNVESEGPVQYADVDAKTLLLGDFAENGTWWTGKAPNHNSNARKDMKVDNPERNGKWVDAKTPRINWQEVDEWYSLLASAGSSWRARLDDIESAQARPSAAIVPNFHQQIEREISEARFHLQRVVLKASENLLRRPGRPIKRPEDCRFLLILLANPALEHSSPHGSIKSNLLSPSINSLFPLTSSKPLNSRSPRTPSHDPTKARNQHQDTSGGSGPQHAGITKRILGLISCLNGECHQHLGSWFSRLDGPRFRRLVDLIGNFVSYRLAKQNRRKRSNSHDPTGGLIPDLSGPGGGTSAHLHAALGVSSSQKKSEAKEHAADYSNDWQIRAAAKAMSLLFFANNHDWSSLKQLSLGSSPSEHARARTTSGAGKRIHCEDQIVPTNAFYNSLLDYADLVADFEAWELRRAKFSFCQYPFFLSIWAKIRILEHDARRQMEIKAREAFFDSIMTRKAVNQYLVLRVRRDCLVDDSLRTVSEVVGSGQEEIKKGIRIDFVGEEGIDSGGLRKEWFLLLVREIFDPEYGLFTYDDDSQYCYFNPNTFETSDQFFLVGTLLGLAIYNSTILDVALPPFAFRKLLASAPTYTGPTAFSSRPAMTNSLDDLAEYRPALAHGLRQLLSYEGDVKATFDLEFVVDVERYGQIIKVPLCPNGDKRAVTNSNRREYVDLYVRYLLETSVSRQYEPFKRGFFTVCGGNALSLFRPEEIELLVRGSEEPLDVALLRSVATYENWGDKKFDPYEEPTINWFWEAFAEAAARDQRKLLSFITGSDRIPAMGATSLVIKIVCHGKHPTRFPTARTCFNTIALYKYPRRDILQQKLWQAVLESEGFGIK